MSQPFQTIAIANFDSGLFTARDKIIAPKKSWRELVNTRLVNGRLVVRAGYDLLGTLYHRHKETFVGTSGLVTVTGTLSRTRVHPGEVSPSTYKVTIWDGGGATPGGKIAQDNGAGAFTGASVITGTINYGTGAFSITFNAAATSNVQALYEFEPGLGVTGLHSFNQASGIDWFVATDTKRFFAWNTTEQRFYDRTASLTNAGVDIFTGADDDLFWFETFVDNLLLVNNVNPIQAFDPAGVTIAELATDFDSGSAGNDLDTCRAMVKHRGRLIAFNTTENGAQKPQRARRSNVNSAGVWSLTDFSDAPTNDHVLSAFALNDDIVVFMANGETWVHRYTGEVRVGEFRAPYEWVKIDPFLGSDATHAIFELIGEVGTLGEHGVVASDGRAVREVDAVIPDFHGSINFEQAKRIHALTAKIYDEAWIAYAGLGSTYPNEVLAFNYREQAFSKYLLPARYFGEFHATTLLTHDTATTYTYDTAPGAYDSVTGGSGFPRIAFGDGSGRVFLFEGSQTDFGTPISARMRTQFINPYEDELALCGWVDVICDAYDGAKLTVKFYKDGEVSSYLQEMISLSPASGSNEKIRKRIRVNQRAQWHQFELEITGAPGFALDAFAMAMKPDGPVREVNA